MTTRKVTGMVVSRSGDKSIAVEIVERHRHPLYDKQYRVNRKYHAHDGGNEANIGDKVQITAVRPISKLKSWNLVKIVEKAKEQL